MIVNSSGTVFVSVDYVGVFRSVNQGTSWTNVSSGLQTSGTTVRHPISFALDAVGFLYAGTNNFGTYRTGATTIGIQEVQSESMQLDVFPNPAQSAFTVETNSTESQTLRVFDMKGHLVISTIINGTATINAAVLSEGVYNVSVASKDAVTNKRIVIVR